MPTEWLTDGFVDSFEDGFFVGDSVGVSESTAKGCMVGSDDGVRNGDIVLITMDGLIDGLLVGCGKGGLDCTSV